MGRRSLAIGLVLAAIGAACSDAPATTATTGTATIGNATTAPGESTPSKGAASGPQTTAPSDRPRDVSGTTPAPEFPDGLDWLNTSGPLRMADLQGKVVLLDFWTYGCINCIHIIPDLKRLEEEYADELVVIGVHSAKFTTEQATEHIRQVILRYGLEHPVVNDPDFDVWWAWGVNAWPTVFLVDPAGNVLGGHAGEGVYDVVEPFIAAMVDEFGARGELDRTPLEFALESDGLPRTLLSFPGKVLADPASDRLFVADSGNHRIIQLAATTGEVVDVYGSGRRGYADGTALDARFDSPQGLALHPDGDELWVADTNNHTIRAIDLTTGRVSTVLGTGTKASTYPPAAGTAPAVELSSPWDLAHHDGRLYIAMAGSHQVWSLDPSTGAATAVVGTGGESTRNGPGAEAELAQPSGVVVGGDGRLYFADSESSSIRFANLASADFLTATLAGSDQSLFEFGDEDGTGTAARFQHPLGIEWEPTSGTLLVADTYNSKIKRVDPTDGRVTTLFGGEAGWADGPRPRFYEPGGLSVAGPTLYVADTNNHAIRVVDLATGVTSTLVVKGIERFAPPPDDEAYRGTVVRLDTVTAGIGPGSFILDIVLPAGHKVNEDAPSSVTWDVSGEGVTLAEGADRSLTGVTFPVEIPADFSSGSADVTADTTVIYCREDAESLCFIEQLRFHVSVAVSAEGSSARISLPYRIELPQP